MKLQPVRWIACVSAHARHARSRVEHGRAPVPLDDVFVVLPERGQVVILNETAGCCLGFPERILHGRRSLLDDLEDDFLVAARLLPANAAALASRLCSSLCHEHALERRVAPGRSVREDGEAAEPSEAQVGSLGSLVRNVG
jgi:hypothetical protein